MANSGYYLGQYKECKRDKERIERNIKKLTQIRDCLNSEFYDEQDGVNKELNDLREDLNKAVRHNSSFANIAAQCDSYREGASTADTNLNNTLDALNYEIALLNNQRATAESNMTANYSQYQTEKDNEYRAWLESLNII